MNYSELHGRTIAWDFAEYDKKNPEIWRLFKKFAKEIISKGKKTSSKLIINRIRWEVYVEVDTNQDFKINDAFTAHYARKYIAEFPEHREFFEIRAIRSL